MRKIVASGNYKSVAEIIERNTGIPANELDKIQEYTIRCLVKQVAGNYEIQDLNVVANVLHKAAKDNVPITVVGDYDADGVTATAIMVLALYAIGIKPKVRLPKRLSEGFGLSEKIVDEISKGIIITVDNGIAAINAIKKAKAKGLKVIVTDHHLPNKDDYDIEDNMNETGFVDINNTLLPEADYIINPHLYGTADFPDYCGAGIAYKIAKELISDESVLMKLSGYAAIGTVADVMPLLYDNRKIVKEGLSNLVKSASRTSGIDALLRLTYKDRYLTSTDIAFTIAPMINAPGRMYDEGAMISLTSIIYNGSFEKAEELAKKVIAINENRKQIKKDGIDEANINIVMNCLIGDNPLCIYEPSIPEGIVGIIAGSIAAERKVPCFVFTDSATPGVLKGSGRAYGNVNIKDMLDSCSDLLYKYGGHKEAAGVSVELTKFDEMKQRMNEYVANLPNEELDDNIYYDLEIDAKDIDKYIEEQRQYEPYGQGNPKPVYYIRGFDVLNVKVMGSNNEHIKHIGRNGEAIGFGMTELYKQMGEPRKIDIIGTLSENYFNDVFTPQIEIIEMKQSKLEIFKNPRTKSLERAIQEKLEERRSI